MNIVVVVPTIRYETEYQEFLKAWDEQFRAFSVDLITIEDGDVQKIHLRSYNSKGSIEHPTPTPEGLMGDALHLVPKKSPACRNLGFAWIAYGWRLQDVDMVLTLDDDTRPFGDTIGDHLRQLRRRVPVSWLSSTADGEMFMRGFPYVLREEAPVWVSHGVWHGVPDLDAATQLVLGEHHSPSFYKGPVPKGIYMPICGMNLAFRPEALPYIYYAPVVDFPGAQRFDDIWMGIHLVNRAAEHKFAIVTGYAAVKHERASNVWKNLQQEAVGMQLNEAYWFNGDRMMEHPWFRSYWEKRTEWLNKVSVWLQSASTS